MYSQPCVTPRYVVIVSPACCALLPSSARYFSGTPTQTSAMRSVPTR